LYCHHHLILISFPHVALVDCFLVFLVVVVIANSWPALVEEFGRGGVPYYRKQNCSFDEQNESLPELG
jgi:hypothetical protein